MYEQKTKKNGIKNKRNNFLKSCYGIFKVFPPTNIDLNILAVRKWIPNGYILCEDATDIC